MKYLRSKKRLNASDYTTHTLHKVSNKLETHSCSLSLSGTRFWELRHTLALRNAWAAADSDAERERERESGFIRDNSP